MIQMSVDEVKNTEIEILDYIDSVCQRNGFTFFLAYGTLIGAIRHKGFIPWDDDIDIFLPRSQYYHFIDAVKKENTKYKIISHYNDAEYKKIFIKVVDSTTYLEENTIFRSSNLGVYVDVFPLDNLPNSKIKRLWVSDKAWYLRQIMGHDLVWQKGENFKSFLYKLGCLICHLYGWERAFRKLEKLARKMSMKKTNYLADFSDMAYRHLEWNASCIDTVVYLPFEGKKYPAPGNYGEILKEYGDYMQLPPLEMQVSNHDFKAFYR